MVEQLQHRVDVTPSFYLIREAPSKNYGVSCCRVLFYVIGEKGAVQFMLGTMWAIEKVRNHLGHFDPSRYDNPRKPEGWDIGCHSRVPMYDDQTPISDNCSVIGGPCYYDGSSLYADNWIEGFLGGGTDWLWPRLEQYYRHTFFGEALPDLTPVYKKHPDETAAV